MSIAIKRALLIFILAATAACGARVNKARGNISSNTLLERQCSKNSTTPEAVTTELSELYNHFLTEKPYTYYYIPEKIYDYKSPLVVNLVDLKAKVDAVKRNMEDDVYLEAHYTDLALETFYLYQSALRYEGAKCQLRFLSKKISTDITPYLSMKDFCSQKGSDEICTTDSLLGLSDTDATFVHDKTVLMCGLLNGNIETCSKQYSTGIVGEIQKRFRDERYSKLFTLKDTHLKFLCEKNVDKTTMKVKIYKGSWDLDKLQALATYIERMWTKDNFILNLEIIDTKTEDVIEIIPTNKAVSYVMDKNNHNIYLSQMNDVATQMRVIAHEFGHVLGFPDCYTEFYDRERKSLIYYEISKENTNIMCSMKNGVSVPNDYLDQLTQKSCLFN